MGGSDSGGEGGEENHHDGIIEDLRSNWEFAAVCHFCRLFSDTLKIRPFSADLLERSLIDADNYRNFLGELHFKLLRVDATAQFNERDIDLWETLLYDKLNEHWSKVWETNPVADATYWTLSPDQRLSILNSLCEWRLDECDAVRDVIKRTVDDSSYHVDSLKQVPIGTDASGNRLYHFSTEGEDCYLYKEIVPKGRNKKEWADVGAGWETVCTTLEEIESLASKLNASRYPARTDHPIPQDLNRNKGEKLMGSHLSEEVLPKLIATAQARERADKKQQMIESMPRKRSSRIVTLASKKDEDERLRQEAEQRERENRERREQQKREKARTERAKQREEAMLARRKEEEDIYGVPLFSANGEAEAERIKKDRSERYEKRLKAEEEAAIEMARHEQLWGEHVDREDREWFSSVAVERTRAEAEARAGGRGGRGQTGRGRKRGAASGPVGGTVAAAVLNGDLEPFVVPKRSRSEASVRGRTQLPSHLASPRRPGGKAGARGRGAARGSGRGRARAADGYDEFEEEDVEYRPQAAPPRGAWRERQRQEEARARERDAQEQKVPASAQQGHQEEAEEEEEEEGAAPQRQEEQPLPPQHDEQQPPPQPHPPPPQQQQHAGMANGNGHFNGNGFAHYFGNSVGGVQPPVMEQQPHMAQIPAMPSKTQQQMMLMQQQMLNGHGHMAALQLQQAQQQAQQQQMQMQMGAGYGMVSSQPMPMHQPPVGGGVYMGGPGQHQSGGAHMRMQQQHMMMNGQQPGMMGGSQGVPGLGTGGMASPLPDAQGQIWTSMGP